MNELIKRRIQLIDKMKKQNEVKK